MDYEDVINFNLSAYNETEEINPPSFNDSLAHEILFGLCCTAAFFADLSIVYTILYFKRMRTVSNILIANWAIFDILTLLVTPSGYRLIFLFEHLTVPRTFLCVLFKLGSGLHLNLIFYVFIVLIDWSLAAYFPKISKKIRVFYKYILGFSWAVLIILSIVYVNTCRTLYFYNYFNVIAMLITFSTMTLYVIILHCVRAVQKCRRVPQDYSNVSLYLITSFVCCNILAFFNLLLIEFNSLYEPIYATIGACAAFCNSIVTLTLLYFFDRNFKAYFLQILRCNAKKYESQINDNDFQHNDFTVQVSFHTPTEELLSNAY